MQSLWNCRRLFERCNAGPASTAQVKWPLVLWSACDGPRPSFYVNFLLQKLDNKWPPAPGRIIGRVRAAYTLIIAPNTPHPLPTFSTWHWRAHLLSSLKGAPSIHAYRRQFCVVRPIYRDSRPEYRFVFRLCASARFCSSSALARPLVRENLQQMTIRLRGRHPDLRTFKLESSCAHAVCRFEYDPKNASCRRDVITFKLESALLVRTRAFS